MSLTGHLIELRKRLVRSALAIGLGAIMGWLVTDLVWGALEQPVRIITEAHNRSAQLVFPTVTGAFDLRLQIAVTLGVILASPIWLYQAFAYFVPALTRIERRYVFGFFFSAVPLFLAGCASGWLLLPHMVTLLTSFVPSGSASFLDAVTYYQFVLKLMLAVGVAYVVPVFLVLLNFMGVLSAQAIIRNWRFAILGILTFAAIATPAADIVSMFLLAIPMVALYLLAWVIAAVHDRRAAKRAAAMLADSGLA
ncbi:MAG TPA: twin-arginine translocase subunit TatC [Microbacteriaceae bacterium]|nr:twin-arginine translocase subunit TatC [Microbacteriaceae bacterium]